MFAPLRRQLALANSAKSVQKRAYSDQLDIEGFLSRISNVIENSRKPARPGIRRPKDDQNRGPNQRPRVQGSGRWVQGSRQGSEQGSAQGNSENGSQQRVQNADGSSNTRYQPRRPYIRTPGSAAPRQPAANASEAGAKPQWATLETDAAKPGQVGMRRRGRVMRRQTRPSQKPLITATRKVQEIPPLYTPDEAYQILARNVGTSVDGFIPAPDVSLLSLKNDLNMVPVNSKSRLFLALQNKPQDADVKSFVESNWFKTNVAGSYSEGMLKKSNSAVAKLISLNPSLSMGAKNSLYDRISRRA